MNIVIKHAMMLSISCRDWDFPKHILMETEGKPGERLGDIAKRTFEKYKETQKDEDIHLLNYSYYGDVEVGGIQHQIKSE